MLKMGASKLSQNGAFWFLLEMEVEHVQERSLPTLKWKQRSWNYWETLKFLLMKKRLQTWKYVQKNLWTFPTSQCSWTLNWLKTLRTWDESNIWCHIKLNNMMKRTLCKLMIQRSVFVNLLTKRALKKVSQKLW